MELFDNAKNVTDPISCKNIICAIEGKVTVTFPSSGKALQAKYMFQGLEHFLVNLFSAFGQELAPGMIQDIVKAIINKPGVEGLLQFGCFLLGDQRRLAN